MSVRSSEVMKEKELHLREFARARRSALSADSFKLCGHFHRTTGFARTRIYAIFIYGCRF